MAAMDPMTLLAGPSSSTVGAFSPELGMDDTLSFDNYCIVCDRLIIPPKEEKVEEPVKEVKPKKKAVGSVRVRNADGTVTVKKSQGTTIVRPGLKRNGSSANRLAAVAAGNNATARLQPLTRSKTADPAPTESLSSETTVTSPPHSTSGASPPSGSSQPRELPFRSAIYCTAKCAQEDAGRSSAAYKDIARTLSFDFNDMPNGYPLSRMSTSNGILVTDPSHPAPPSPLFISGSDTDSSVNGGPDTGPACSAPNTLEFFRMGREGPDAAWHDVQRQQRRSSMNPAAATRPLSLARQQSNASSSHAWGDVSSTDSLSSLWNTNSSDADLNLARSTSTGPRARVSFAADVDERASLGINRRSMSHSSERSAPIPARPALSRSNLSHTSLGHSPIGSCGRPIPPEFGSQPNHTLDLLQSYHQAFPVRTASGTSSSYKQKGFVFPSSFNAGMTTSSESRRGSYTGTSLQRPTSGTIRAKSRSSIGDKKTWDEYGREEVEAHQAKACAKAMGISHTASQDASYDYTPKQSLDMENGKWKIRYTASSPPAHGEPRPRLAHNKSRVSTCSRGSSDATEHEDSHLGLHISRPTLSTSASSTSHSRTPLASAAMPPPEAIPMRRKNSSTPNNSVPSRATSSAALPDVGSLKLGPGPVTGGYPWQGHEKQGGKMYDLPPGIKVGQKAGLFFFPG